MKLLFATDFSSQSREALDTLAALKHKFDYQIFWINVASSFWRNWFSSGRYEKEALQRLSSWQQKIDQEDTSKLLVSIGNISEEIIIKSKELKSDLIVLASKSDKATHHRIGTTAQAVVRGADQSVWIAKSSQINKVLCAIDLSPHSRLALKQAITICKAFSAECHITYVIPGVDEMPFGLTDEEIKQLETTYKAQQEQQVKEFLDQVDLSEITSTLHCLWGNPSTVILDLAEDENMDLIVVGAKGHSALHNILIGSTVEKIMPRAPCSIFVVR